MNKQRLYRLLDLIEDLKQVDQLIALHSSNPSSFVLKQYLSKKEKLIVYLIDELVEPSLRSPKSFFMIHQLLSRFYPNLSVDTQNGGDTIDFRELQAALTA
jgi:hypothetical protein